MNRRKLFAVLCLLSLCLPMVAWAEWVQKEIKWSISGVTGDGASIYIRDTTRTLLNGANVLDTTGSFSLAQAEPLRRGAVATGLNGISGNQSGGVAAYNSDTTVIAYLVFQADSTAAPSATLTTATWIIEGRAGGFGPNVTVSRGWVKVDSLVMGAAAGAAYNETHFLPLRTIGVYSNIGAWAQLRARTLTAVGVLGAARAFVRYWRPTVAGSSE